MKKIFLVIIFAFFYQTSFATICNPFSIKINTDRSGFSKVMEGKKLLFKIEGGTDILDHLQIYLEQAKSQNKMMEFSGLEGGTIEDIDMLDFYLKISEKDIEISLIDPFETNIKSGSFSKYTTTGAVYYDDLFFQGRKVLQFPRQIKTTVKEIIEFAKREDTYLGLLGNGGLRCESVEQLSEFLFLSETPLPQKVNSTPRNNPRQITRDARSLPQENTVYPSATTVQPPNSHARDARPLEIDLDPSLLAAIWGEDLAQEEEQGTNAAIPSAPPEHLLMEAPPQTNPSSSAQQAATQNDDDEKYCVICLTEEKNYIFMPCFHIACCESCATDKRLKECPICRKKIAKKHKVYQ